MKIPHAVVWLDHHEAKILFLHEDDARFEEQHLKAAASHGHNHHRDDHHHGADRHFFEAIAKALEPAQEVLVAGPGQAKNEFKKFAGDHAKALDRRIVGVESIDHPTEGQLATLARKVFRKVDAMLGNTPLL